MVATDGETVKGGNMSKKFPCNVSKKRNERPNVGGVSFRRVLRLERDAWSMVK